MAKQKIKYITRKVIKRAKKKASSSFLKGNIGSMLSAGLYGGVRAKISNALEPVTAKLPGGEISDEIGMLALAYLAKGAVKGDLKQIPKAAMTIEAARIGEFIMTKGLSGLMSGQQQQKKVDYLVNY